MKRWTMATGFAFLVLGGTISPRFVPYQTASHVTAPRLRQPAWLSAVSCVSTKNCTAVGSSGSQLLAEAWNGKSWKTESAPRPPGATSAALRGVSCASVRACVAVGTLFKKGVVETLADAWNGKTWKTDPTPNPAKAQSGPNEGS